MKNEFCEREVCVCFNQRSSHDGREKKAMAGRESMGGKTFNINLLFIKDFSTFHSQQGFSLLMFHLHKFSPTQNTLLPSSDDLFFFHFLLNRENDPERRGKKKRTVSCTHFTTIIKKSIWHKLMEKEKRFSQVKSISEFFTL